jgi:hypothetical protein
MDFCLGIVALFNCFLVGTFDHFYCPSHAQAAGDGRHDLLLCLFPKQYLKTAAFASRMMQKGSHVKFSGTNNDI